MLKLNKSRSISRKIINEGQTKVISNASLSKQLQKSVFDDLLFQNHVKETAIACKVDHKVADFVIKHYLSSVLYALHLKPKTYSRLVMPLALSIKLHMNKFKSKLLKNK